MIGITGVGTYIPKYKINNKSKIDKFDCTIEFIDNKIGINSVSRKEANESASDLCARAFQDLLAQDNNVKINDIDFICVCTQNGDYQLPQTSAILHYKLGLSFDCASFDISLGCSGYVYALLTAKSFMEANGLNIGVVFTADPYSEIIDSDDKNTDLLFGDAATATLLTKNPLLDIGKGVFGTEGKSYDSLILRKGHRLYMNGRGIFNFVMRNVPRNIKKCLETNKITIDDIDIFLLHQASKYVLSNLVNMMKIDVHRVPFTIRDYGNTVSSSIPIILKDHLFNKQYKYYLLCGFGVGLSVASLTLRRI